MKHLIALSFKYIRRQKLRSALTFLCITLAVFIFNTFSAYFSSIRMTMLRRVIAEDGSWEVNLTELYENCEDQSEAADILQNHAAVDEYYYRMIQEYCGSISRDEAGRIHFFDLEFDNGMTTRVTSVREDVQLGDIYVMTGYERFDEEIRDTLMPPSEPAENAAYFPSWVEDLGYAAGDEVTITITPVSASLSEDSPQVQATWQWINENNASEDATVYYSVGDVPEDFVQTPSADERQDISHHSGGNLVYYMLQNYTLDEIEVADAVHGTPYTFTLTIAGFREDAENPVEIYGMPTGVGTYSRDLMLDCSMENTLDLNALAAANPGFSDIYDGGNAIEAYATISERIEFEDGLLLLMQDLGFTEGNDFIDYFGGGSRFHNALLALKCRSADAIAEMIGFIAMALIVALVVWLLTRFIIDNAFEISVQERSRQFAALRIMGASRGQLVALIFTEAVFYCLTAVPIGVTAAFLSCAGVMEGLSGIIYPEFTFDANPVITTLGVLISVAGIFTSAYTSAMWAARKLSPIEALQYGKPKKKPQRTQKRSRSELNSRAKGFVMRYTIKNILRTKSRFLISTVAQTLGIALIVFSLLTSTAVRQMAEYSRNIGATYDFMIHEYGFNAALSDAAEDAFADNELFAEYKELHAVALYEEAALDGLGAIAKMRPYGGNPAGVTYVRFIGRTFYEAHIEALSGMSYDDFLAAEAAMVYTSAVNTEGSIRYDRHGLAKRQYPDSYESYAAFGYDAPPVVTDHDRIAMPLIGAVCFQSDMPHCDLLVPVELAETMLSPQACSNATLEVILNVSSHENYEAAKAAVEQFRSEQDLLFFTDTYDMHTGLTVYVDALFSAVAVFLVSVWLVGVLSMTNSINTSVLNRQRELIMLRAVGMTKRQLMGTVVLEGMLFSAVSTVLGILMGILGFSAILDVIDFGLLDRGYKFIMIFAVTGGILLVNLLIAALCALPGIDSLSRRLNTNGH